MVIIDYVRSGSMFEEDKRNQKAGHKTFKERFADYEGEYVFEELDTGPAVGCEMLEEWQDDTAAQKTE
jgi:hypothetical protein